MSFESFTFLNKSLYFFENVYKASKCPIFMKKTSIFLEIILKGPEFLEKASHHFKKASIPLKMSLKSLVIIEKVS
jgi:hypothetical protein